MGGVYIMLAYAVALLGYAGACDVACEAFGRGLGGRAHSVGYYGYQISPGGRRAHRVPKGPKGSP